MFSFWGEVDFLITLMDKEITTQLGGDFFTKMVKFLSMRIFYAPISTCESVESRLQYQERKPPQ